MNMSIRIEEKVKYLSKLFQNLVVHLFLLNSIVLDFLKLQNVTSTPNRCLWNDFLMEIKVRVAAMVTIYQGNCDNTYRKILRFHRL